MPGTYMDSGLEREYVQRMAMLLHGEQGFGLPLDGGLEARPTQAADDETGGAEAELLNTLTEALLGGLLKEALAGPGRAAAEGADERAHARDIAGGKDLASFRQSLKTPDPREQERGDLEMEMMRARLANLQQEKERNVDPAARIIGQAALEGGDIDAARQAGMRITPELAGSKAMSDLGKQRWVTEAQEILTRHDYQKGEGGPERLVGEFGGLMGRIRQTHPGQYGEQMARDVGEMLTENLYGEVGGTARFDTEHQRYGKSIIGHKENQFGAGQAGVDMSDFAMPLPPRPFVPDWSTSARFR